VRTYCRFYTNRFTGLLLLDLLYTFIKSDGLLLMIEWLLSNLNRPTISHQRRNGKALKTWRLDLNQRINSWHGWRMVTSHAVHWQLLRTPYNIHEDLSVCVRVFVPIVRVSVCLSVCLSVTNRLINHATQRDQTFHESVNKSGECLCQRSNIFRTWSAK